jgi:hypothetical protein
MGVLVGVGDGESVNVGDGRVGWLPSTVNGLPSACGLRSAVCGRQAANRRLRARNRIMNRGKRDMVVFREEVNDTDDSRAGLLAGLGRVFNE